MRHQALGYRPALDGLRAIAVLTVIVYHGRPGWLPGGWLGVDLFFVISGFLITTLLLTEWDEWGRIDLWSFWAARARRLFPALAVVLLVVLVAASRWTVPGRREAVSQDVLATMGYVANWRFLLGDEGYFSAIASPSPVRHAWSLAVEEQFYVVFPIILAALLGVLSRRRALVVGLGAAALVSAWWMAHLHVPGVDPSRVYYGTDTRAQELLIGAALAAAVTVSTRWRRRVERAARVAAIPALLLVLSSMLWWDEGDDFVFRGGLTAFCLAAGLVVIATWTSRTSVLQRSLAWEPLRRIGAMSYGLYLWHWPVMIFGTADRVGFGGVPLFVGQVLLTFALAAVSLRFVEQPVRRRGFRALLPSRPRSSAVAAALAVPVLLAGTLALPSVTSYAAASGGGKDVRVDAGDYRPLATPVSVMLMGNSVPASAAETFPADTYSDIQLSSNAYIGCDPFPGLRVIDGVVDQPSQECVDWSASWPKVIRDQAPDLVALFVTQSLLLDREVDGERLVAGTPAYADFVSRALDTLQAQVTDEGAGGLALVNLACHRLPVLSPTEETSRTNDDAAVEELNAITARWAAEHGVPVVDQYALLCAGGYHDTINGVPLYKDHFHFDERSGAEYWRWLAPELRAAATRS